MLLSVHQIPWVKNEIETWERDELQCNHVYPSAT